MARARRRNFRRRRTRRRNGPQRQFVVDVIQIRISAGSSLNYRTADSGLDIVFRPVRILKATLTVSTGGGSVGNVQMRILNPAYEAGQTTVATSQVKAVSSNLTTITVRGPSWLWYPAGRPSAVVLTIDHLCDVKGDTTVCVGVLKVVWLTRPEFLSESCPTYRLLSEDGVVRVPHGLCRSSTSSDFVHMSLNE